MWLIHRTHLRKRANEVCYNIAVFADVCIVPHSCSLSKAAGVAEIHMRISSPPIRHPCFYGIDMPTEEELIAANQSVEMLREFFLVASLHYLSLEGMVRATARPKSDFCLACFNGDYPVLDNERTEG